MKVVNYPTLMTDRANFILNYYWLKFKSGITEENYRLAVMSRQSKSLNRFTYSLYILFHLLVFCLYLASYLESNKGEDSSKSLIFKIILIVTLILANLTLLFTKLFFTAFSSKKTSFFELNYFAACMILIFNSSPFHKFTFEQTDNSILSTLGICAIIIFNISKINFNYRFLLIYNLIICVFHGVTTLLYDSSNKIILQNLILYLVCLYHITLCYSIELNSRKNYISNHSEILKDVENGQSQIEEPEYSLNLINCIQELQNASQLINTKPKVKIEKVIRALKVIQNTLAMQDSYYENFADEIDEEDKIYIQQSCLPNKISEPITQKKFKQRRTLESIVEKILGQEVIILLKQVTSNWNIDMFQLNEKSGFMPITIIGKYCMKLFNLNENLGIAELKLGFFFNEIQKQYKNNPYHNAVHAADVLVSGLYLLKNSDFFLNLLDIEMLTVIISHLAHDVAHPGLNNRFLINFNDDLAIEYNDISVLESMHASLTFKILKDKDKNILESLSKAQVLMVRKWVIELILSTDMAKHFDLIAHFRSKAYKAKEITQPEAKLEALKLVIHSADIGHTAKETELHKKWSKLLAEEFFHQGDIEKEANQPVSMYCDRETTVLSKSQIGFLKNIALPLFELLSTFLNSKSVNENCLDQLKNNISSWEFEYSSNKLQTLRMGDYSKLNHDLNSPLGLFSCQSVAPAKVRISHKMG